MKCFYFRNRRIIVGYNGEARLRFGIHREELFWAVGIWPLLIGVGRYFNDEG